MSKQPGNPPSKPVSKDPDDLIASMQKATAELKKVARTAEGAGGTIVDIQNEQLKRSKLRLELRQRVSDIYILEKDIEAIKRMSEPGKRKPEEDSLLDQLASMKTDLEGFLKKNNLGKVSYDTLKREMLKPIKRWQLWRRSFL